MLKLLSEVGKRKKQSDEDLERFFFHHPTKGVFICLVVMPLIIFAAVITACMAIVLPISFFMGWM